LKYHSRYLSQIPLETVLFPILIASVIIAGVRKVRVDCTVKCICQCDKVNETGKIPSIEENVSQYHFSTKRNIS